MFWSFCLMDFRAFCAAPVCSKTYIFVVRFDYFQGPKIIDTRPRNCRGTAEERPRNGRGTARGGIAGRLGPQAAAIVKDNY